MGMEGLVGGLFGKKQAAAPTIVQAPEVKSPATMPDESSAAIQEAKRRERMRAQAKSGRASTILTAPEQRGGTDSYKAVSLGAE